MFRSSIIGKGREAVFAIMINTMDTREIVRRCCEVGMAIHCRFHDAIDGHFISALGMG